MSITTKILHEQNHEQTPDQTFDVFGVLLQFLVTPQQVGGPISLSRGTIPPGVIVPLHSHPEPEIFYVLNGGLEVYVASGPQPGWSTSTVGEVMAIPGDVKHALRNTSSTPAITIMVAQDELYKFFCEIAKPSHGQLPAPPSPEEMQKLFQSAGRYHYWMGSPADNAAIGIPLGEPVCRPPRANRGGE
jgi:quercetin dioxygenase-like cupin family protein